MLEESRPRTKNEWRELVDNWLLSGQSMAAWCRANQVVYHRFLRWKKQIHPEGLGPINESVLPGDHFIEIAESPISTKESGVALDCRGISIRLAVDFDADTLQRCLQALRAYK